MQTVRAPLAIVRRALRASNIEVQDCAHTGTRRMCRGVGLLYMRCGLETITVAVFR